MPAIVEIHPGIDVGKRGLIRQHPDLPPMLVQIGWRAELQPGLAVCLAHCLIFRFCHVDHVSDVFRHLCVMAFIFPRRHCAKFGERSKE
ncbi:hypothetical protein SDC9_167447 [bioreactor metagenome]|uniref:Uncharacterized protein n=1 Tax=bioreactor metagenome TaxID=1076179 RepID=A0A645FZT6_9ZZZZ